MNKKFKNTSINLSLEQDKKILEITKKEDLNRSQVIRRAIQVYLTGVV